MTTERDPRTRIVLSWLHEDAHEDAERVLLRTLDEVDTTSQRRAWWPAWRFADMNTFAKMAIGAAAVVVVAFAAIQFFPVGTGPGGGPAATPSPTPTPALLPTGSLIPGPYALDWDGPPMTIEVPSGWTGGGTGVIKNEDTPREISWGSSVDPVTSVYRDACLEPDDVVPLDGTLQGFVNALDAQVGTDATIADVTLGGRPAKRIDLAPSPGIEDVVCQTGDPGLLQIWPGFYALGRGAHGIVHLLEIDDELVIFIGVVGPEATAGDKAELEAIIASTQIP
jgi:hypothetical protein